MLVCVCALWSDVVFFNFQMFIEAAWENMCCTKWIVLSFPNGIVDKPGVCNPLSTGSFQTCSAGGHVTIPRLGCRGHSIEDLIPHGVLAVGLQSLLNPSKFKFIITKVNLNGCIPVALHVKQQERKTWTAYENNLNTKWCVEETHTSVS